LTVDATEHFITLITESKSGSIFKKQGASCKCGWEVEVQFDGESVLDAVDDHYVDSGLLEPYRESESDDEEGEGLHR
jgi:hypothetical protein